MPRWGCCCGVDDASGKRWGLTRRAQDHLEDRYLVPQPRTAVADLIAAHASAAMDVSDGLAGDLAKLCRASDVAAEIEIARVPLSDAARAALGRDPPLIETILTGGDDYEIVAAVPARKVETLRRAAAAVGVPVRKIGKLVAGQGERALSRPRRQAAGLCASLVQPFLSGWPTPEWRCSLERKGKGTPCTTRPPLPGRT